MKTIHYLISGRVQGVFFRYHTKNKADKLNIRGTVRNLPNGDVEVFAQGDADALTRFETFLHQGPPSADVKKVSREILQSDEIHRDFQIVH